MTWGKINTRITVNTNAYTRYTLTYPIAPYEYKTTMAMADNVYLPVGLASGTQSTIDLVIRNEGGPLSNVLQQFMWFSVGQY